MSVMQTVWSHPNSINPNSPPNAHLMQMDKHHFHFPPTGLLAATTSFNNHLKATGRRLSHAADGERGAAHHGSISSWSPNTDIRQTKLAYHIEIEVPGTTDKETMLIQWLGPSTLVVRGEVERPFVGHGKAAEGAYEFQQGEESGDGYTTGSGTGRAQDGTDGHGVNGGAAMLNGRNEPQSSRKEEEHDGQHVANGHTYQSSTGSKNAERQSNLKGEGHGGQHVLKGSINQTSTGAKNVGGQKTEDGGELKRMITDEGDECADIPMFLLQERKTGPWQRTFTLPHNVEMQALRARLDGGLLRIDIPINDVNEKPGMKVQIE